jgi:arsenate reductase
MLTLYGIKNCDTVKKARRWLEEHGMEYQFHDFRLDGLDKEKIRQWIEQLGWESVVNKRSTTWRNLSAKEQNIDSATQAINLLLMKPTLIKRPVVETEKVILIGFKESEFAQL